MTLEQLRTLDLATECQPGRPAWLSAASGLIHTAGEFCVIADDELHLGRFGPDPARPGRLQRLLPGTLPVDPASRKRLKPDLEVLLHLPACAGLPHGALLAMGSGSSPRRCRGALLALNATGRVVGRARLIDATRLFARLSRRIAGLNIEGGFVADGRLNLLQRANRGSGRNVLLRWDLAMVLQGLLREHVLADCDPVEVREFDLGDLAGVPLGFTDASPLAGGGWMFSAVAEDTANARDDGPCAGSVLGLVDARCRLRWIKPVQRQLKIEGIDALRAGARLQAWLVTDADDPRVPARLLRWVQ